MVSIQIYLNSSYATQCLNQNKRSELIYYFSNPVIPPPNMYMTMSVSNLTLPVSWYLVDSTNNKLVISGVTYTLTSGNYNSSTLATMLDSILPSSYTVSFSSITNKLTFTNTSDFTISKSSTCLKLLGFDSSSDTSSVSKTLTSTYPIDLSGQNMLYLDIVNLKTTNISQGNKTSIVKSFMCDVAYGSVLYFTGQPDSGVVRIDEDHIGFLHLRLLGEDGVTCLDLQNGTWQVTLEINFVHKTTPTVLDQVGFNNQKIFEQYIKSLNGNGSN